MATGIPLKPEEGLAQTDVDLYAGVDEFGNPAHPVRIRH